MTQLHGLGVSDGIAVGRAVCISARIPDIFQIPLQESDVESEVERFHEAVRQSREDLSRMGEKVEQELGHDLAGIFEAQSLFLADGALINRVVDRIRDEHVNAEWALQEVASGLQARFDEIDAEHLRERGEDLRDVCRHVVRSLRGIHLHHLSEVSGNVIIVADDLTPSDAVRLGRENVVGFAIEHGSRTSHTTIIARSLNIPAVTGLRGLTRRLADAVEVPLIVDGTSGTIILYPTQEALDDCRRRIRDLQHHERELLEESEQPAVTRDGVEIQVMANIDLPEEMHDARRFGAAGIGLYRSEFLYIEKSPELPTEEEHVALYRQIIDAAAPNPAIIRTYDLGGRKIAREVLATQEENPVLGLRGIRLTLTRPDIFKTQIRALLRAAVSGDLWILLPMVSIVEEVRQFRRYANAILDELEADGLEHRRDFRLGVMIEVPCAAMISDILAREVDFFSIGTNDLIQYSLAVDRNNEHVANLYLPLHPAILRMLRMVCANAAKEGIEVSLCGEMAADATLTPVLLGCGLRRLSVSPRKVPDVKRCIRGLDLQPLASIVETCSNLPTVKEIEAYLRSALSQFAEID